MQVEYSLARITVRVDDRSIPRLGDPFLTRDLSSNEREPTDERRIVCFVERRDVLSRYDQNVNRRFGIDVAKGHELIVAVNDGRWNGAGHDAAEQAVGHVRPDVG